VVVQSLLANEEGIAYGEMVATEDGVAMAAITATVEEEAEEEE